MNKEQYLAQRKALLDEAEKMIGEGKTEEANAKMKDIEALDTKWDEIQLANANMNALKGKATATSLENESVNVAGGKVIADMGNAAVIDEKKQYENAWAKTMQGKKLDAKEQELFDRTNIEFHNAYTHDTGNTSILIPESVVAGIWKRAEEGYALLADVKKFNVKGTLTFKKHTAIAAGDAAWYDEDTATADEQNTFAELSLSGCELAKAITVSWKLKVMATEEFIPYIINELGERVGVVLGKSISTGKGKPGESDTFKAQPKGIETALLAESSTPQVVSYDPEASTADPLAYEDFTSAISKVHSSYLVGSAVYANNTTIWTQIANLKDGNERPLFIPDVTTGGVGHIFGMVVKPDAGITDGTIIIGNPNKGYVMNTNEPMSVATEDHVKTRTTDYAAYTIVDGDVLDTKAFALIRNTPAA
jgi:HK97 family phage major capsid protein